MQQLDATFAALADPTRRAIIARLTRGESSLSALAEPFDMSLTAVSKHVRVLCDVGIVTVEKRGRTRHCRLDAGPMKSARDWLDDYREFWTVRLDALSDYLSGEDGGHSTD